MGPLGSLGGPWVPLLCPILAEKVPLGGRKLVQSAKGEESGVPCLVSLPQFLHLHVRDDNEVRSMGCEAEGG